MGDLDLGSLLLALIKQGLTFDVTQDKLVVKGNLSILDDQLKDFIKKNKSQIIDFIRKRKEVSKSAITVRDTTQLAPLSFAQQRLWVLDKIDSGSSHYNIPVAFKLFGALNIDAFNLAFKTIFERHESLRTCFAVDEQGEPYQVIQATPEFQVNILDLSHLEESSHELTIAALVNEEAARVFDLGADLMLRVQLLKIFENEYIALVTFHHIASDGWSLSILINEFSALYSAYVQGLDNPLPALEIQYADYAQWQRTWLKGEVLDEQLGYWETQLGGLPVVHSLPLDHVRPLLQSFVGKTHRSQIDIATSKALSSLCHAQGATLFMGLHAAFSVLLSRYSNEMDIVVGSPIANREQPEAAALIGFFVNTLVLRSDLSGNPSFNDLLGQSKNMLLDAYAHQQVPFEQIVERLQPERSLSHNALFQVMLVLQNNEQGSLDLPGLTLSPVEQSGAGVAKYDLKLSVHESAEGLDLSWGYNTDLFESATISRMAEHLASLLNGLLITPDENVFKVDMLSAQERQQLLVEWNDTAADYPKDKCIHELFEFQAENNANTIAIIFEEAQLTYSELNRKANQLAHFLVNERGVKPDTLVGICVERSLEVVIGILAILKAGGAYVPLDPDYPEARLKYMLDDANLTTVLTQRHLRERTPVSDEQAVCLDDESIQQQLRFQSAQNPIVHQLGLSSNHLAYVIYTSGSTGNPKGVMVEHHAVVNLALNIRSMGLNSADQQWGWNASYAFDSSLKGISQLILGNGLHIISEQCRRDPLLLVRVLGNLNVIDCTPMMVEAWFAAGIDDQLPNLILGGEAISPKLWALLVEWQRKYNKKAVNVYGPTECTVDSTGCEVEGVLSHIGRALPNTQLYVLNHAEVLAGKGIAGELHIGGVGLARGYLNRPDLTAEKFIANPFYDAVNPSSSERLYKTGDLVRWLPGGNVEFLGRIDHQVKIRGFRVEVGEIESALSRHVDVKDAIVLAKESASAGDKRLVAYVVTEAIKIKDESDAAITAHHTFIDALRHHLSEILPDHMVPSVFMLLDKLPLTPNGKVDRKSLPEPEMVALQATYIAPRDDIENVLCKIWQEVLGVEHVGVKDNFFRIGGNSLLTVKLQLKINQKFNSKITVADVFSYTTIESLAKFLGGNDSTAKDDSRFVRSNSSGYSGDSPIAIIGMSCRFPDAPDVETFWENIASGKESIKHYSDEELLASGVDEATLTKRDYVKKGIVLEGLDLFDANYFDFTPREAEITCPQQRLLLESSVETLEYAGYGAREDSQRVGVFVGASISTYFFNNIMPGLLNSGAPSFSELSFGLNKDAIATRISYKLNLTGPSVSLHTACSTSLMAVSQACLNLSAGKCELALVGVAALTQLSPEGYLYIEGGVLSPDGHCRPFAANSCGTRGGSGVATVLLKRLDCAVADGDTIHAVIKGTATNNDGNMKMGYTAPSVAGQANVIREALEISGVQPETIQYIETHGTGTKIGDPIEIAGLLKGLSSHQVGNYCALGSVKANIGHLDVAAGMAGLIKTVQVLKNKKIPPSINFDELNPLIDLQNTPFYINTALKPWESNKNPRRAGLSSFGIGGVNTHIILEEAPLAVGGASHRQHRALLLTAKTKAGVIASAQRLKNHFIDNPSVNLIDAEFSLQVGREHHKYRKFIVCESIDAAIKKLDINNQELDSIDEIEDSLPIVFMFPGQGAEYVEMAKELYWQEPLFKEKMDICADLLMPELSLDIRDLLYPESSLSASTLSAFNQTEFVQPVLFAIEYSLAQLWMSWGVVPSAVIGHSLGEYVAACLSGVFSLSEGLKLIVCRARLMQSTELGRMISVLGAAETLKPYILEHECELAAVNSETNTVLSGSINSIENLEKQLIAEGFSVIKLKTERAFHSKMMDPILDEYRNILDKISFGAQKIPVISNLSGTAVEDSFIANSDYWLQHLRNTVNFSGGIAGLLADGKKIFLEVGPGTTLGSFVRKHSGASHNFVIASLRREYDTCSDEAFLLNSLGELWRLGFNVKWKVFHQKNSVHRIPLPAYPFERKSYWINSPTSKAIRNDKAASSTQDKVDDRPLNLINNSGFLTETEVSIMQIWQDMLGIENIGIEDSFFDLGGDSLLATRIMSGIREKFSLDTTELPLRLFLASPYVSTIAHEVSTIIKNRKLLGNRESMNTNCDVELEEGEI